jgi:EAL domain-containing protein (putative c-di-GMP-specific phosphodiesterase class I)
MDERLQLRCALEADLRKAIANNELHLVYQPLVSLEDQSVFGAEALVRWSHPTLGAIAPSTFIPIAEEIGIISNIGDWVLRTACHEAANWPEPISVAVNLSPVQFQARQIALQVTRALAEAGLAPRRLELEITESVLLFQTQANLNTLHDLRNLGVRISMDDFGTGYSSLSYLRAFPFDKIKIDRTFVGGLPHSADCVAIVRALCNLGKDLGIKTLAEGVETEQQYRHLCEAGYTQGQGYYFSKPVSAEQFRKILLEGSRRNVAA